MSMVIYLAGPVRGHEDYQEKFHEAEMALIGKGWVVLNPARLPRGMDEKKYMPICMAMLAQADAIFLLDGWETSQGANVELRFAECQGMYVYVNMRYVPEAAEVENGDPIYCKFIGVSKEVSKAEVIDAFDRCFCRENKHCPGCYQDGPGFGFACRKQLCRDLLAILREEEKRK